MRAMQQKMITLPFMKMHGLGNDFVIIDSRGGDAVARPDLVRAIGDRNRGVGFDQLAEILDSDNADIHLTFWNADGSRAGACGNATRCVADFLMRELGRDAVTIETRRGLLHAAMTDEGPSVNMGPPQLEWDEIPVSKQMDVQNLPLDGAPVAVGMGNPHCVFFVPDMASVDPAIQGPPVEKNAFFPQGTNVEFAQIIDRDTVRMRVWERGAGITLACGSGACATLVAAVQRGLTNRRVRMQLDGGWLMLDWRDDGVWMTGPVAHVFDGVFTADWLGAAVDG